MLLKRYHYSLNQPGSEPQLLYFLLFLSHYQILSILLPSSIPITASRVETLTPLTTAMTSVVLQVLLQSHTSRCQISLWKQSFNHFLPNSKSSVKPRRLLNPRVTRPALKAAHKLVKFLLEALPPIMHLCVLSCFSRVWLSAAYRL